MEGLIEWWTQNSWLYFGSLSGSLVAMMMARGLKITGRLQTLAVGTITGCVAGPAICEIWFSRYDPQESSVPSLVCAFVGLVALGVIPIIIKKFKEALTKYQFKIVPAEPHDE